MKLWALGLSVVLILAAGCRKKPSEFARLEAEYSALVTKDGDDAFESPQMDAILKGLQAVPADAADKPNAQTLAQVIISEQHRVATMRHVEEPPAAEAPPRRAGDPEPVDEAEALAAGTDVVEDAGPPQPKGGMDEKAFLSLFGSCFAPGPPVKLEGGLIASSQVLSANADCQKRFGAPGAVTSYLFADGGLWGKSTDTRPADAGSSAR